MEIFSLTQQRTFCPLSQKIQPLATIGCEHLEGFCLNPPDVYSKQLKSESVCCSEKTFAYSASLSQGTTPVSPPGSSASVTQSALLFFLLLLKIVPEQALHHITASLSAHFISVWLSGGVQATAAHAPRPERGGSELGAAPGQGKRSSEGNQADVWDGTFPLTFVYPSWKKRTNFL